MFLLPSQWYNGTVIIISTPSSSSAQTCLGVRVGWDGGGRVVVPPGAFAFVALIDHRAKLNHHHTARQPLSTEGLCHRHPCQHHHWHPCAIPILYFDLYALCVIICCYLKRVELNVCESFKCFTHKKKNICYFKSPISPWRGPQSKSLFELFFLTRSETPPHTKSALTEAPFSPSFRTFFPQKTS